MFKNYLLVGFRNLIRHRYYTLLNVVGLAVGIACALLIWIFVQFEKSYDTFHARQEQLYRVVTEQSFPDGTGYGTGIPAPFPDALQTDFPQVDVTKVFYRGGANFMVPEAGKKEAAHLFKENDGIFYLEPTFFKLFDFSFLSGNAAISLSAPNQVVLTQAMAEKYFGDWRSAVGKILQLDDKSLQVSGVLQNPPLNTDFPLKIVVSYATLPPAKKSWDGISNEFQCYVALPRDLSEARFNQLLEAFHKKHQPNQQINHEVLQPLRDIHYSEHYSTFSGRNISHLTLRIFLGIGAFLIIMACVNFVNLATAQAFKRAKEIGVRKVLGGDRSQLFGQLMLETALIVLLALVLAVIIASMGLPWLSRFFELPGFLSVLTPNVLWFLVVMLLVITLLAGFYPAMVISGFRPVAALKNSMASRVSGGISLRRALVVVQFGIAQIFIVCTILVVSQLNFIRNYDLGFKQDALVFMRMENDSISRIQHTSFKTQLLQTPGILEASYSSALPSDIDNNSSRSLEHFDHKPLPTYVEPQIKYSDTAFFRTYGLQLVAGRAFQTVENQGEAVINETLLRKIGLTNPDDAIGKTIKFYNSPGIPIVGVVKDFHNFSLRGEITPIVLTTSEDRYRTLTLKVAPAQLSQTLTFIRERWQKAFPKTIFDYQFVDEGIARYYVQEEKMLQLFKVVAGIALLISCLGVLGLLSFTAQQRTKEIGIRKVLGASVANIVALLSKDFLKLVLLANVIAWPLAWWGMQQWLQNYHYRTNFSPWIFVIGGALAIIITLVTVSFQTIKAAISNPVEALRSE